LHSPTATSTGEFQLAARGITYDINYQPYDYYNVRSRGDDPGSTLADMQVATDIAESRSGWQVLYLHSMDMIDGYGDWGASTLASYLSYLKTKDLWVDRTRTCWWSCNCFVEQQFKRSHCSRICNDSSRRYQRQI
jgi:hypothetical protein